MFVNLQRTSLAADPISVTAYESKNDSALSRYPTQDPITEVAGRIKGISTRVYKPECE